MKKYLIFTFFIKTAFLFSQTPADDPHWQLILSDDFNTLDRSVWKVANNFDHYGGEPQVYIDNPNNVFIDNGNLVIKIINETYVCPPGNVNSLECARQYNNQQFNIATGSTIFEGYGYTSGWLETLPSINNLQFGYYEANIKFPYNHGYWPAFWTFVAEGLPSFSNAAEIDIAEQLGKIVEVEVLDLVTGNIEIQEQESKNLLGTNIHRDFCANHGQTGISCPTNPSDSYCAAVPYCYGEDVRLPISDYSLAFHKYAIEWSPTRIIWYFDDVPVRILENHQIVDPIRIILGFGLNENLIDGTTTFPAQMEVDYVKVYQLTLDCNESINTCTYDFPNHDNKVKNEITIGGTSCTNILGSPSNTYIRASNFIELKGDFIVPLGATFFADASGNCSNILPVDNCAYIFNPCNYDFVGYDNGIKKQISLGDNSCSSTIYNGNTIMLHATESITLKPGFTAESGSDVTMQIVNCY